MDRSGLRLSLCSFGAALIDSPRCTDLLHPADTDEVQRHLVLQHMSVGRRHRRLPAPGCGRLGRSTPTRRRVRRLPRHPHFSGFVLIMTTMTGTCSQATARRSNRCNTVLRKEEGTVDEHIDFVPTWHSLALGGRRDVLTSSDDARRRLYTCRAISCHTHALDHVQTTMHERSPLCTEGRGRSLDLPPSSPFLAFSCGTIRLLSVHSPFRAARPSYEALSPSAWPRPPPRTGLPRRSARPTPNRCKAPSADSGRFLARPRPATA